MSSTSTDRLIPRKSQGWVRPRCQSSNQSRAATSEPDQRNILEVDPHRRIRVRKRGKPEDIVVVGLTEDKPTGVSFVWPRLGDWCGSPRNRNSRSSRRKEVYEHTGSSFSNGHPGHSHAPNGSHVSYRPPPAAGDGYPPGPPNEVAANYAPLPHEQANGSHPSYRPPPAVNDGYAPGPPNEIPANYAPLPHEQANGSHPSYRPPPAVNDGYAPGPPDEVAAEYAPGPYEQANAATAHHGRGNSVQSVSFYSYNPPTSTFLI